MRGTCLCGDIAYEAHGLTFGGWGCSCDYCRKFTGTAFAFMVMVLEDNFEWTAGESLLAEFEKLAGTGPRRFCSRCGAPMPAAFDGVVGIPAGTLDDPIEVELRVMLRRLPAWGQHIEGLPSYDDLPAEFYVDQWQRIESQLIEALNNANHAFVRDVSTLVHIVKGTPGFDEWWSGNGHHFGDELRRRFDSDLTQEVIVESPRNT